MKMPFAPTMRDRLSHLSFDEAAKLLGREGKTLLIRGGGLELPYPEALRIDAAEARVDWMTGPDGYWSRLFIDSTARGGIRAECSLCDHPCEHVGGLLSILLEQKSDLGLAAPPATVVRPSDDAALVLAALDERAKRAKAERMKIRSANPKTPWTDYQVLSAASGKTYRVALRGETRGVSYCSCPDFKLNTLGTCKHIMKVQERVRSFPAKVRKKAYRRTRITVHVRYVEGPSLALALPHELSPEARAIVTPLLSGTIEVPELVKRLQELEAGGHAFFVTPDAEELMERRLLAARTRALVTAIRRAPAKHPLRTTLLRQPLLPYQLDGIAFAVGAGRAILADEMGLGKTIQGVGVAELMAREYGIKKVLIVCPASLKSQWRSEITRFSGRSTNVIQGSALDRSGGYESDAFFTICNYEQVLKDIRHVEKARWDLIILDEGQRIKNWEAKTSRVIKGLASRFALVLSGTPLENRLDDLHSVVAFVDPHQLGPAFRFLHRHQRRDHDGKLVGFKNLDDLRERLRPILLRRTRDSVRLELPPRTMEMVRIAPTPEQKALHDGHMQTVARIVRKPFLTEMDLLRLRMALLMCRMAANSTFLVDKQKPGHSSKLERLAEIFDGIAGEPDRKVLLFSEWTTMLDLIAPLLDARKLAYVRLDGSVPQKKRQALVSQFQSDPKTRFFLTTNAGSSGLNLQAANTVINVDLPWNPAVLEQRIARAHRMGQTRPVSVFVLVTEQTLEENLLTTLGSKRDLALAALDPESKVSTVDVRTQSDDLKDKLEILLGKKPEAQIQEPAREHASRDASTERIAMAGQTLLRAAIDLLGQLTGGGEKDGNEAVIRELQSAFDAKLVKDEQGAPRLSLAIPPNDALAKLLRHVADRL